MYMILIICFFFLLLQITISVHTTTLPISCTSAKAFTIAIIASSLAVATTSPPFSIPTTYSEAITFTIAQTIAKSLAIVQPEPVSLDN